MKNQEDDFGGLQIGVRDVEQPKNLYDEEDFYINSGASPIEIIKDISQHKNYIADYLASNHNDLPINFNPNQVMSFFGSYPDTMFIANGLNQVHDVSPLMVYYYFYDAIEPRDRYVENFFKHYKKNEDIILLSKYFNCSVSEMKKNLIFLDQDTLQKILLELHKDDENDHIKIKKLR